MSKEQIQNIAVSSLLFGAIFGGLLFLVDIGGMGTASKVIALAVGVATYVGLSVLLVRRKNRGQR